MTEQEKEQQFRDKVSKLENRISELLAERERIFTELGNAKSELYRLNSEKDKLLQIVENLSKGFAKMGK